MVYLKSGFLSKGEEIFTRIQKYSSYRGRRGGEEERRAEGEEGRKKGRSGEVLHTRCSSPTPSTASPTSSPSTSTPGCCSSSRRPSTAPSPTPTSGCCSSCSPSGRFLQAAPARGWALVRRPPRALRPALARDPPHGLRQRRPRLHPLRRVPMVLPVPVRRGRFVRRYLCSAGSSVGLLLKNIER